MLPRIKGRTVRALDAFFFEELKALRLSFTQHDDLVRVTLFSKEQLAVVGELFLAGIARNERIEVCGTAIAFGPQDATESLRFLLPRSECA